MLLNEKHRASTTAPASFPVPDGLVQVRHSDGVYEWIRRDRLAESEKDKARGRRRRRGRWDLAAAAAALALVVAIAGLFVRARVQEAAFLTAPDRLAVPAAEAEKRASAAAAAASALPLETRAILEKEIARTLESWADAWSRQQTERYLAFYSDRFVLPEDSSRESWETFRSWRLLSGGGEATLDEIETSVRAPDRAGVRLVKTFRTPYSVDRVSKTLELVRESGRWKIVEERTVEAPD